LGEKRNIRRERVETTTFMKTHANNDKKSSKFTRKITHVDDIKISCPNSNLFVRYKNNKFLTDPMDNFLA
jgi:hypothetical protein